MELLTIRVNEDLAEQLRQLADEEQETLSTIARRVLRRGLVASGRTPSLVRAREGTGRVR